MLKKYKDIIIVVFHQGAGPVGLTAALFLKKFNIPFTLLERKTALGTHPSAHYLNMRTMEVLSEIKGIDKKIEQKTENIEYFRNFRYCRRLFDKNGLFSISDHFSPSIAEKYRSLEDFSFKKPIHLPQFHLVEILYNDLIENLSKEHEISFGKQVENINFIKITSSIELSVNDININQRITLESRYLIASDGFHSTVREKLGIEMMGFGKLQSFINIFFESKKLAFLIKQHKEFAMLHFIYNSEICAVLVNHSLEEGLFVLQIPIHPPFDSFEQMKNQEKMLLDKILSCFELNSIKYDDICIKNVGMWNLSGQVADSYYRNHCFLVGDSAHSFPPAGGFGLNTGIQDIHNLIHKLIPIIKSNHKEIEENQLFQQFSKERRSIGTANLNTAMRYYEKSLEIPRILGLDIDNLRNFKKIVEKLNFLPSSWQKTIFTSGVKIGAYPVEIRKFDREKTLLEDERLKIPLIFIKEDVQFSYKTSLSNEIHGKLCPLFSLKLQQKTDISMSSRELPNKIFELEVKGFITAVDHNLETLKTRKICENLDFLIIFYKKDVNLEKIRLFLKNLAKPNMFSHFYLFKINFSSENLNKQIFNEILVDKEKYESLFKEIEFFCMRSDGHIL